MQKQLNLAALNAALAVAPSTATGRSRAPINKTKLPLVTFQVPGTRAKFTVRNCVESLTLLIERLSTKAKRPAWTRVKLDGENMGGRYGRLLAASHKYPGFRDITPEDSDVQQVEVDPLLKPYVLTVTGLTYLQGRVLTDLYVKLFCEMNHLTHA